MGMFISTSAVIGPIACCSRVSARPSQKNTSDQAWLSVVGLLRPSGLRPSPRPLTRPSSQPKLALWHDAQDSASDPDMRGSKNSTLPSSAFSGLYRFSGGNGVSRGRRKDCFREVSDASACAAEAPEAPSRRPAIMNPTPLGRGEITHFISNRSHPPLSLQDTVINALFGL